MSAPSIPQLLGLLNRNQVDGFTFDVELLDEKALRLSVKAEQIAVRHGTADGVLIDDLHVAVGGLTADDLKAPGPHLLQKAAIRVRHFTVRISRDWINGVIERDPMGIFKKLPVSVENLAIVFDDANPQRLLIRGKAVVSFEVELLLGVCNNRVTVNFAGFHVMGFLPFPKALRNLIMSIAEGQAKRPGVTFDGSTVEVDVQQLAPVPVELRLSHFQTRGRYLVVEGGDV